MEIKFDRTNSAARLAEIAPEIATALGDGWTAAPFRHNPVNWVITGPAQQELHLLVSYPWDGKVDIYGHYPDRVGNDTVWFKSSSEPNAKIGAALTKTGVQIARDIARRLLPGYQLQLEACLKAVAKHRAYRARQAEVVTRIGAIVGVTDHAVRKADPGKLHLYHTLHLAEQSGDVEVHSEGITIKDLGVSFAEGEAILELLVRLRAEKKA